MLRVFGNMHALAPLLFMRFTSGRVITSQYTTDKVAMLRTDLDKTFFRSYSVAEHKQITFVAREIVSMLHSFSQFNVLTMLFSDEEKQFVFEMNNGSNRMAVSSKQFPLLSDEVEEFDDPFDPSGLAKMAHTTLSKNTLQNTLLFHNQFDPVSTITINENETSIVTANDEVEHVAIISPDEKNFAIGEQEVEMLNTYLATIAIICPRSELELFIVRAETTDTVIKYDMPNATGRAVGLIMSRGK